MQCTLLWLWATGISPFHNLNCFLFIVNMKIKLKSSQVRFIFYCAFYKTHCFEAALQIVFLYCVMYLYFTLILNKKIGSRIIFIRPESYPIIPEQVTGGLIFESYLLHVSRFIYECLSRKCKILLGLWISFSFSVNFTNPYYQLAPFRYVTATFNNPKKLFGLQQKTEEHISMYYNIAPWGTTLLPFISHWTSLF